MGDEYFLSRRDAIIKNRVLIVPLEVKAFYLFGDAYILKEEETGGYKYLSIFPEETWLKETTDKEPINFTNLEAIVRGKGVKALRLPQSSLEYLNLGENSKVCIIGNRDHFEVWAQKDFGEYESSIDLRKLRAVIDMCIG